MIRLLIITAAVLAATPATAAEEWTVQGICFKGIDLPKRSAGSATAARRLVGPAIVDVLDCLKAARSDLPAFDAEALTTEKLGGLKLTGTGTSGADDATWFVDIPIPETHWDSYDRAMAQSGARSNYVRVTVIKQ